MPGNKLNMQQSIFQYLPTLKAHEHLCHLYYNDTECYEIAAKFLAHSIKCKLTCVVISDRRAPLELISRLEGNGVIRTENGSAKAYEEIIIKNSVKENKRASTIVSNLRISLDKVLEKGRSPVRVLVMYSYLFYFLSNKERLWKKAFLNKLCMEKSLIMMNQYPVNKISSQDLISIMKTHPTVVENNFVYESPMYLAPDTIIKDFDKEHDRYNTLSAKEQRLLVLITSGLSNSGIAEELS